MLLVLAGAVAPAWASSNPSYDAAMQACATYIATPGDVSTPGWQYNYGHYGFFVNPHCVAVVNTSSYVEVQATDTRDGSTVHTNEWSFTGAVPPAPQPCTDNPPASKSGLLAGKYLKGYTFCASATSGGVTAMCEMRVSLSGPPTMNQWGSWNTPGTTSATGNACSGAGGGGVKGPDGNPPPAPVPPDPNTNPPQNPPPKKCGGGSCYDPSSDSFCMVDASGAQTCVPGGSARGDQGGSNAGTPSGNPPGACMSSGDSTICAGTPTAPAPPPDKVPDPPTAATGHDSYTQANPATGGNQTIVVNTYTNQGGTPTTSGQKTGDTGPASSSSAPAPSSSTASSYGGGGDCASPPICKGDAVMCGVARQEWVAMCQAKTDAAQLHKDLAGSGPPTDFDALKSKYGQADAWGTADTSQDGTVGGQANAGVYDQSGFGYATTCPLKDMSISLGSHGTFVIPLADKCVVGDWLRSFVIGFALFGAAIITAGGRGGN